MYHKIKINRKFHVLLNIKDYCNGFKYIIKNFMKMHLAIIDFQFQPKFQQTINPKFQSHAHLIS